MRSEKLKQLLIEAIKETVNDKNIDNERKVKLIKFMLDVFKEKKDYKEMCQSLVGESINDFFCNGFFGSSTYDLGGSEISRVYESEDGIAIKVKKIDGRYDYGYFNQEWRDWETVYEYLCGWIKGEDYE